MEDNSMKDVNGEVHYKGRAYKLVFNLNVMEAIQEEYGSIEEWGNLTDGSANARKKYESSHRGSWDDLSDKEKAKYEGEADAKAVIFGFAQMINEGIDIDREDGEDIKPMTLKQVGRMITEIGLNSATDSLKDTVIRSAKSEEKNA
jgi:hypothetical protein